MHGVALLVVSQHILLGRYGYCVVHVYIGLRVLPRNFCQRGKKVASFPGKKGARAYYGARAMRLLIKSRHV